MRIICKEVDKMSDTQKEIEEKQTDTIETEEKPKEDPSDRVQ